MAPALDDGDRSQVCFFNWMREYVNGTALMLLGLSGYQQPSEYPYLSYSERSLQSGLLSA